jgi:hypothetical protein
MESSARRKPPTSPAFPTSLLMPSSFCLPPVEASAGTIPTQAENSWPFLKAAPFPMAAIRAVAGAALREQE